MFLYESCNRQQCCTLWWSLHVWSLWICILSAVIVEGSGHTTSASYRHRHKITKWSKEGTSLYTVWCWFSVCPVELLSTYFNLPQPSVMLMQCVPSELLSTYFKLPQPGVMLMQCVSRRAIVNLLHLPQPSVKLIQCVSHRAIVNILQHSVMLIQCVSYRAIFNLPQPTSFDIIIFMIITETGSFFKALGQVGTDFTMMTLLLPKRSRKELKVSLLPPPPPPPPPNMFVNHYLLQLHNV